MRNKKYPHLYDTMWLFVFFDLPTQTALQRSRAAKFRKYLLFFGFNMLQYSVYTRHCGNHAHTDTYQRRIKFIIPPEGSVVILRVRDDQFSNMVSLWGGKDNSKNKPKALSTQLTIF